MKSSLSPQFLINNAASNDLENGITKRRFKNFNDDRIFRTIKDICYTIGQYSDLQVVVDYHLEVFMSSARYRKEVALMLNLVIQGKAELQEGNEHNVSSQGMLVVLLYFSVCFIFFCSKSFLARLKSAYVNSKICN